MQENKTKIVVGIGNSDRRDDGIGIEIIRLMCLVESPLLQTWRLITWSRDLVELIPFLDGYSHVILIDGLCDPLSTPGFIWEWDLVRERLPKTVSSMSTHSFGIGWVVELMATMGKMPQHFHLIGVVMADCGIGVGLSPSISKSMDQLMHKILRILARVADV